MRRKFGSLVAALSLLTLSLPTADALSLSATSAILVDGESGRVLWEQNADEPRLIASVTKLMTALVAAEHLDDLSDTVSVQADWLGAEGSSIYLAPGEQVTYECLLYGLLLESGNDAANVLACSIAGSIEGFALRMNEKAAELGMAHTSFENPSGLDGERHYSTARDLAVLASACLNNEVVAGICATRTAVFGKRVFVNHNRLLAAYEGCVGMKTGYTRRAGRTLISAAEREGQTLIAVTLNAPDDWNDHKALLDFGFEAYPQALGCEAGEPVGAVPVKGSLVRQVAVVTGARFVYPLSRGESLRREVELLPVAEAPVTVGEWAGEMRFYLGEELVGRVDLVFSADVEKNTVAEQTLLQRILSAVLGETITVWNKNSLV